MKAILIYFVNFLTIWTSVRCKIIPYYLGNTLIMIDSQDFNLPRNREPILPENKLRLNAAEIQGLGLDDMNAAIEAEKNPSNDFYENENEVDGVIDDLRQNENYVGLTYDKGQMVEIEDNEYKDLLAAENELRENETNEYNDQTMPKDDTISVELKIANPRKDENQGEILGNEETNELFPKESGHTMITKNYQKLQAGDQDKERNFLYIPLPQSLLESIERKRSEMKEQEKETQDNTIVKQSPEEENVEYSVEKPTVDEERPEDEKEDIELSTYNPTVDEEEPENEKENMEHSTVTPTVDEEEPENEQENMEDITDSPPLDEERPKNADKTEIEPIKMANVEKEKIEDIQVEELIIPGKNGEPSTTLLYVHSPSVRKNIKKSTQEDLKLQQLPETAAVQTNNIHDFLRLKSEWDRKNNAKQKSES